MCGYGALWSRCCIFENVLGVSEGLCLPGDGAVLGPGLLAAVREGGTGRGDRGDVLRPGEGDRPAGAVASVAVQHLGRHAAVVVPAGDRGHVLGEWS